MPAGRLRWAAALHGRFRRRAVSLGPAGGESLDARAVSHRHTEVAGLSLFLREAGPIDAPVLLPHGYPCSSYPFRHLMPALADRWRAVVFDWPGFGYSATPDASDFDQALPLVRDFLGRTHG